MFTTNTPAIHALNRVIVVILSESVIVFAMGRILPRRWRRPTRIFDGPVLPGMPNWTEAPASAVGHRGSRFGHTALRFASLRLACAPALDASWLLERCHSKFRPDFALQENALPY